MPERLTNWRGSVLGGPGRDVAPPIANDSSGGPDDFANDGRDPSIEGRWKTLSTFGARQKRPRNVRRVERDFDMLRLRILAGRGRGRMRNDALVVALMSRTPEEGVSTVAAGLARAFVRNGDGRVLLVDADDTTSGLTKSLPTDHVTVLTDSESIGPNTEPSAIKEWGIDFVALGANGSGRFTYGLEWEDYFSAMRARYDVIIVDTGCLERGTPYNWSGAPSHVILVVDTTRTTVKALERLREELKASGPTVTGVVLNKRTFPIPRFLY